MSDKIGTVVTPVVLRASGRNNGKRLDSLSPGDKVVVVGGSLDGWLQVRVFKIANGKYASDREGVVGWVYAKSGAVDVNVVPPPVPEPEPDPIRRWEDNGGLHKPAQPLQAHDGEVLWFRYIILAIVTVVCGIAIFWTMR